MRFKVTFEALRINAGWERADVARIMRVSEKTVQKWESYELSPTVEQFKGLCALYHCPMDNVLVKRKSA